MTDYTDDDKQTMLLAARARNKSRLQELIDYARFSGCQKLGIACCKAVLPYAEKLTEKLEQAGFEVYGIHCKQSGLDGAEIAPELSGPCCDPVSQAEYLNRCGTDLNVEVGLCLGHGLLFRRHSRAPVTTFLVKDFATGHKTIENLE